MVAATLVSLVLAGSGPLKVAMPGLQGVNLTTQELSFFSEQLAHELSARGLKVISSADIAAVVGLERERQLVSCDEAAPACMAEMANAMGVDGLVTGQIAKLGSSYQVLIKILGGNSPLPLASFAGKASSEEDLSGLLTRAAVELSRDVHEHAGQPVPPEAMAVETVQSPPSHAWAWVTGGAGAALLVGGGVCLGLAAGAHGSLTGTSGTPLTDAQAAGLRDQGSAFQTAGWVAGGVGVAAVAGAAVLFFTSSNSGPRVSVTPLPGGVYAGIGFTLP